MNNDLKWKQRFLTFEKTFKVLQRRIDAYKKHPNDEACQWALVQSFNLIHGSSWKVLKDYLQYEGVDVYIYDGPKKILRKASQNKLILKIEPWMEAIAKTKSAMHIYDENILREVIQFITVTFHPIVRNLYFQLKKEL